MSAVNLISTKPSPPEDGPPRLFDRALVRQHRQRAARTFQDHDFLHARAADDLVDRLALVNRKFDTALIIGGGGTLVRAINDNPIAREKVGTLIQADIAPDMARHDGVACLALDEEALPIAEASVDLVLSALSLHWTNDLVGALIQINYALKPDGLFAGAIFGGSTLHELRSVLKIVDGETAPPRISPFADTIDMAGLLGRAGFAMPVSDIDRVTVRYREPISLFKDLKNMGESNALVDRSERPMTRGRLLDIAARYAADYAEDDGKLPASFDIIHFSGWGPHPDQPKPKRPGSATARLADALGVDEFSAGDKAG